MYGQQLDVSEQLSNCEVEIKNYVQQKGMVKRVLAEYVDCIVNNLADRFADSDCVVKFSVFVPSCIVKVEKESSQAFFFFLLIFAELLHCYD